METAIKALTGGSPVIPAVRTLEDFYFALSDAPAKSVIALFADINNLNSLQTAAKECDKTLILHLDLMDGLGKDRAGITYLSQIGIKALITTRPQLCKYARQKNILVIQRLFLVDSDAVKSGIKMVKNCSPNVIEVLPGLVPATVIKTIFDATGLPIFAGGLISTREEVEQALKTGICAVTTSNRELWTIKC